MSLDTIDRTMWTLAESYQHIRATRRLHHENITGEKLQLTSVDLRQVFSSGVEDRTSIWSRINRRASLQLRQALRQGYLHAQGRLSRDRNPNFPELDGAEWIFHSQQPVWIVPEHWISGYYHPAESSFHERLELADGEYIDIQIPRFMVEAIWTPPPPKALEPTDYTTPYIDLLDRAIAENGIDEFDQSKKTLLVDWFKSQDIEGTPLSGHLANAMATIIRLPSSQRGGSKRGW